MKPPPLPRGGGPAEVIACAEASRRYGLTPFLLNQLVHSGAVRRPWIDGRPVILVTPSSRRAMRAAGMRLARTRTQFTD